jgi:cobalt-zinc-cadmium resistance protein CzcA
MTYRYVHLYSDDNSSVSANQPEYRVAAGAYNRINLSGAELDKASAEATIRKKELVSNVKSAYYRWIYHHSMVKLLSDRQKTLIELAVYFEPDTESTTSNTIRYYEIESLIAEAETDLVCRIADMEIAANELRMLIMNNDELMPSMNNLTLYQVERISDTATYSGASLINYYREALNVSSIKTKLKKSAFFPDITIGLINQKIQPFSNLWAWQVGLQIPLIFANEAANTKKAVLDEEIALNNLESSLFHTEKEIENLLIELINTLEK